MTSAARDQDVQLAEVWRLLDGVFDPEIPVVTIQELGILRDVRHSPVTTGAIDVVITPTYSGCPAMGTIADDIRLALGQAGLQAHIVTQLAPAWTTDWMSDSAKEKLLAYGIAPPQRWVGDPDAAAQLEQSHSDFAIQKIAIKPHGYWTNGPKHMELEVFCPQCRSPDTTEVSHFASTACKALYKCLNCMEPFDHFKPH